MSSSSTSISSLHSQLKSIYSSPATSTSGNVAPLLTQAKIALAQAGLLLPSIALSQGKAKQDVQQAREILSYGALLSVRNGDTKAFVRYWDMLRPFWDTEGLGESELQAPLTGLALLRLLANNEIAGFHTLLEELSAVHGLDPLLSSPYTSFPISLERWLMEGSYSKIFHSQSSSPLPEYYNPFLSQLISTVRDEIASCGEKAYSSLPLQDAAVLLFMKNKEELLNFASQRKGWQVNPQEEVISFVGLDEGEGGNELPKERVVETILGYAKELETIV